VATEVGAIEQEHPGQHGPIGRPYGPSWADLIVDGVGALPGPEWLAWVGFAALALAWTTLGGWLGGVVPAGTLDPIQTSYAILFVFPFLMIRLLDRAAAKALRGFAPALHADPDELDTLEYELTTAPALPALLVGLVGAGLDAIDWIVDPRGAGIAGSSVGLAVRAAGEFVLVAGICVLMYQAVRQLRAVARLHARAMNIDLFRPSPLYAFSRLTALIGFGFVLVAGLTVVTSTPDQLVTPLYFGFLVAFLALGVAAFVVPLWGLHSRLVAEKHHLTDAANERLKATLARLHASVDGGDMSSVDQIQKTFTSLVQERDLLARLRTWPWDPSTFRAFASAIALPIVIWLLTRLLGHVV
jgi:hypothetical protein